MSFKYKLLIIFPLLFIALIATLSILTATNQTTAYPSKLWLHKSNPNRASIEEIKTFLKNGSMGIEFDVLYVKDKFIIAHFMQPDWSSYLTVEEFFEQTKDLKFNIWFDLKNLKLSNFLALSTRLNNLLNKYHMKDRLFVESKARLSLGLLQLYNIKTVPWIYRYKDSPFKTKLKYMYDRTMIAIFNYSGVSCDYNNDTDQFKNYFNHFKKFMFTINREPIIQKYLDRENIEVILTDRLDLISKLNKKD